jgi:GNAT superfamily N-acetyltransferase
LTEVTGNADRPVVREARLADIGELVSLYCSARAELAEMRGGKVLLGLGERERGGGDLAGTFARQLSEPTSWLVVAALSRGPGLGTGNLAGYGACTVVELGRGELLGSIDELYVKPEARRGGLGRALASALLDWCRQRGCSGVDAKALPGNRAVKSFFEGEGFTARLLVMHRRLG